MTTFIATRRSESIVCIRFSGQTLYNPLLFLQNFVLGWAGRDGRDLHKHHHTVPTLLLFLQTIADAQKCRFLIVDHFHQSLKTSRFEAPKAQSLTYFSQFTPPMDFAC